MAVKSLIETVTVGAGGATSIEFAAIPQDGVDLVLKVSARRDAASPGIELTFNSDATDYSHRTLRGITPNVSSISGTGNAYFILFANLSTNTANTFSSNALTISNYASSAAKSMSLDVVYENNAEFGYQSIAAGLWNDTAAITSLQLVPQSGNFVQYSTASLYKIKYD